MAEQSLSRQRSRGKRDTQKTPGKPTRMERFKPHLPYEDFPLFPHQSGRWAKKVRQKLHYFGRLDEGWENALEEWERKESYLRRGKTPPPIDDDGLTIKELCNRFMTVKQNAVNAGELGQRQFDNYHSVCERIIEAFGKTRRIDDLSPDDFGAFRSQMAKRWAPGTLKNQINQVRVVFKFAYDEGLIDRPIRYGQQFAKPSAKVIAVDKASNHGGDFTAAEIRKLLDKAKGQMRAMILLGINCAYINIDIGRLNRSDINGKVIDIPVRVKTGMARRSPLWPETIKAIDEIGDTRPTPKDANDADAVFITRRGCRWSGEKRRDYVTLEFRKLCRDAGVYSEGRGFANLRHVFRTIAGGAGDTEATDLIMGHKPGRGSAAVNYIGNIDDKRLRAVANHVRSWLFPRKRKG